TLAYNTNIESSDANVLACYDHAHDDMDPLLEECLAAHCDLEARFCALLDVKLKYFEPNLPLLGTLAAHADPAHPLSPFSEQTRAIRERDVRYFERALEQSKTRITDDLKPHLPGILWMYQMGIILFWIYDRSEGQQRTRAL